MNLVIHLIGIVVVALALRLHNRHSLNVVSVGNLFSAVWACNIAATEAGLSGQMRLAPFTLAVVYLAWWSFLAGCLVVPVARPRPLTSESLRLSRSRSLGLVLVLCVLQLAAIGEEILLLGWNPALGYEEFSSYRLKGETINAMSVGSFRAWRWSSVIYLPFAIILFRNGTLKLPYFFAVLLVAVTAALPSFTRAPILQLILSICCCWVVWWRPSKRLQLIVLGVISGLFTIIAIGMQIVLGATTAGYNMFQSEIWGYVGGPMLAYQTILDSTFLREEGSYVLDGINFIRFKLDFISSYPSLIRPVAPAVVETNVYTFLDAFTIDFGAAGALLATFGMSNLFSRIQVAAESYRQPAILIMYGVFMHWTAMSGLNNELVRVSLFIYSAWATISWVVTKTWFVGARR